MGITSEGEKIVVYTYNQAKVDLDISEYIAWQANGITCPPMPHITIGTEPATDSITCEHPFAPGGEAITH